MASERSQEYVLAILASKLDRLLHWRSSSRANESYKPIPEYMREYLKDAVELAYVTTPVEQAISELPATSWIRKFHAREPTHIANPTCKVNLILQWPDENPNSRSTSSQWNFHCTLTWQDLPEEGVTERPIRMIRAYWRKNRREYLSGTDAEWKSLGIDVVKNFWGASPKEPFYVDVTDASKAARRDRKGSFAPDSTSQDSTAQDSTAQDSTAQDSKAQDSTAQDSKAQDSTSSDSTSPDSTAQNSTITTGSLQKE